jgi:glycerophosphoryl diester phosphodiesterase
MTTGSVRVLAHRGASRVAPENTLEAFAAAAAQGADGVELDVHRSSDGGLIVHHDADATGFGVLAEHPLEAIRRARPSIPTLEEALDACAGLHVNVEVKNLPGDADYDPDERVATGVIHLLQVRDHRDDVLVSSFNLASIDRVRELAPDVATGFLTVVGFDPIESATVAHAHGHAAVHPDVRSLVGPVAAATVAHAHELGLAVNVWTVNDTHEIQRLAAAGVDAVITDVPDQALTALGRSAT